MVSVIPSLKPNVQVAALREKSQPLTNEKVTKVAIDALNDVVITIYNNTAQISDFFSAKILDPYSEIVYQPLLAGMDQNATYIHLDKGEGFIQSYRIGTDTFSMKHFYQSLVGKTVKMYDREGKEIEGKVLEWNQDTLTLYSAEHSAPRILFYKREEIAGIVCDDLDSKMAIEPSLKANYLTDVQETACGQVVSLNSNFSWRANYRLIIEEREGEFYGKIEADAKVSNRCDKDLKNVVVKVVSGNLNMNMPEPLLRANYSEYKAMPNACASHMQKAAIDQKWQDLKAYLIPYKMNLLKNETISTRLFDPKEIKLEKSHVFHSYERQSGQWHPSVCYHIENTSQNNLGQAFPDGTIQVYKKDHQFIDLIGQHKLEQTPKGKDLKIITSESFDLLVEKSFQTQNIRDENQKIVGELVNVKIELTNASDEDKTLFLHEHLSKGCILLEGEPIGYEKGSEEVVFEVKVPKNSGPHHPFVVQYQYRKDFKS